MQPLDREAEDAVGFDRKIVAILYNPSTSFWLRQALESALDRDVVDAVNDAEVLHKILEERATALLGPLSGSCKTAGIVSGIDNDH